MNSRFSQNWRSPHIERREVDELSYVRGLKRKVMTQEGASRTQRERRKRIRNAEFRARRAKQRRADSNLLINNWAGPAELCLHQVRIIIQRCVERSGNLIFLVLALAIATFTMPSSLLSAKLKTPVLVDGTYISLRPYRRLHRGPTKDKEMYEDAGSELPIFWPPKLTREFLEAKQEGRLQSITARDLANALRTLCPMATWRKLVKSLVRHATAWFGIPLMWLTLAAHPKCKTPAPCHYQRISAVQLRKLQNFLAMFDPAISLPLDLLQKYAFGSHWVLKTERVQTFCRLFLSVLEKPLTTELNEAIKTWNVLSACAYDLSRLFGGLRAGPIPPPTVVQLGVRVPVTIVKQKRVVLMYYPRKMRAYWPLLMQRESELRDRARSAGVGFEVANMGDAIYYHVEAERDGNGKLALRRTMPSHKNSAEAYARVIEFRKLGVWRPGWPRHLSNTILRDAGFHELTIQRFHTHAPATCEPVAWDQSTPAIDIVLNEQISEYLASFLAI